MSRTPSAPGPPRAQTQKASRKAPLTAWHALGWRFAVLVIFELGSPGIARAQLPKATPVDSQAAQSLQSAASQNPGLAAQITQRIQQSGMTPDQIRALLQSKGYPSTLLDAYMPGATQKAGAAPLQPGAAELSAIQALGLPPIGVTVQSLPLDTGLIHAVTPQAQQPESLAVFGVDVFKRTTTQFLPMLTGPVPADYKLQPGDNLVLILTGDVQNAYPLQVTREGFILIPQVGQVYVSGLTLDQLRDLLYTRLGRVYSGVKHGPTATTHFDISVASVGAAQVYVVGEVNQPGAYQVSALGTVLTALYAAGGVTNRADVRDILVRRNGKVISHFDLYGYLLHGDTEGDIRLETGDVIFVGVHGTRATVQGAVVRPDIYELKRNETVRDLIADAGGFKADAALQRISIQRVLPPEQRTSEGAQKVTIDVPLAKPDSGDPLLDVIPPFPIENGDVVTVDSLSDAHRDYVTIQGNVYLPGQFGFTAGMRLSQLVARAGGLKPDTYLRRALIARLDPVDSLRYQVAVGLPADRTRPWADDPVLRDYDVVTVFGRSEMRDSLYVTVHGMVNKPGTYLWRKNMTLKDLMLDALGPKVGADLNYAEVARLPPNREGGRIATIIRAPMDSTYIFDRDSLGQPIGPPGLPFKARGTPPFPLKPYDVVTILKQPDFQFQRTVKIVGQVRYPGTYALKTKGDRLAALIARAGGLTTRAYPGGVRFTRALDSVGRINIDLDNALRDTLSSDDIVLQPGDSIDVPEFEPSVQVTGAVNSPGSVLWKRGAGLDYYVSAAGGTSRYAITSRIAVHYADGSVQTVHSSWVFFHSRPAPGPGSTVVVPARAPNEGTNYVALFGSIAQVLASTMAIILVITKL